jgi:hypothetical protein
MKRSGSEFSPHLSQIQRFTSNQTRPIDRRTDMKQRKKSPHLAGLRVINSGAQSDPQSRTARHASRYPGRLSGPSNARCHPLTRCALLEQERHVHQTGLLRTDRKSKPVRPGQVRRTARLLLQGSKVPPEPAAGQRGYSSNGPREIKSRSSTFSVPPPERQHLNSLYR